MKVKYLLMILVIGAAFLLIPSKQIYAQSDTMVVDWQDTQGDLVVDALYNAVMGDTVLGGARTNLNRVYQLKRGGYYWNTSTITNNGWPLRIVGETPGSTFETAPAVIQMVLTSTGGTPGKMIQVSGDLTLRNLYIIGSDDQGVQGNYYQPIEIGANDLHVYVDNCVFERSDFSMLAWQGGANNDVYITNCHFRNLIERAPTQQWAGRGISMWKDQDTVVVENNTFFNVNMCAVQIENGAAKYYRFNHNTLVNIGRSIHSTSGCWWREAYFTNLLLVNVFWHGEGLCDYGPTFQPGRDHRAYTTGMFGITTMPSKYGTDVGRRVLFANAAAYLDNFFAQKYGDTVRVQSFTNAVTDSFFTTFSPAHGGQMVIKDTSWLNAYPNFTLNPDADATLLNAMYNHITASRAYQYYNSGVQAKPYYYDLQTDPNTGDTLWTSPTWPLPENFTYNDANLLTAGTDGLPLGDLNWFPSSKTNFETNKAQYISQIENMPGGRIVEDVVWEDQAENGTLTDGAQVVPFTGPSWYTTTGGGKISWTFNAAAAGNVDMEITANLNTSGNNVGADILLNNGALTDILGWGQFVFWSGTDHPENKWSGFDDGQWHTVLYAQADLGSNSVPLTVNAGANTLSFGYNWNPISVKEIKFYQAGTSTVIADLIPPDAVNDGCTPAGEGTWVPEGFNSVKLGTNGSASFNIDIPEVGSYLVRLFYQNPGSAQTGSVSLDGANVSSFNFSSKPDSTGVDGTSDVFAISSTGTHTLKITGSGTNVDKLQLIQRTVSRIKDRNKIPDNFSLSQNYPNPFNPTTNINFTIAKSSNVKLVVYNILGQRVATLINNHMNAGTYTFEFNASKLASGVYIYHIQAGDFKASKKMMLLK